MYIDPSELGLFVRYADLSPVAVAETKQRIKDTILAILGGATNVAPDSLDVLFVDDPQVGDHGPLYPTNRRMTRQMAAFVNAWMLRQADWMDSYKKDGRKQAGHPSDQLASVFALCDHPLMTGERLIETVHLAYQLWRAWTDVMPGSGADGWDNTAKLSLCVPILAATVDGASVERLNEALRLSASSGAVLAQVRKGAITNWKSGNSGYVSANSLFAYSLSAAFQGSEGMLDDVEGGWARSVTPIRSEPRGVSPDEIYRHMEMKVYPCFQFGQAPVTCGAALHPELGGRADAVTSIEIALPEADHRSATRRDWQKPPETPSEADHSLAFCLATAMRTGSLSPSHYRAADLRHPTTLRLMSMMSARIMSAAEEGELACVVRVSTDDGTEQTATVTWEELGAGGLEGPDRIQRREGVIDAKRRAVELGLEGDLRRVLALVDDLEGHTGRELLDAIAGSVPALEERGGASVGGQRSAADG